MYVILFNPSIQQYTKVIVENTDQIDIVRVVNVERDWLPPGDDSRDDFSRRTWNIYPGTVELYEDIDRMTELPLNDNVVLYFD